MSIKYGHDDDRIATQYALAHIVRGINHPSQVIQVGDQTLTIGVDQGPPKNGVGSLDTRMRNIDQIPPIAREIALKQANEAIARAGSPPVAQPINKALVPEPPDSHKEILRRVAEHTLGEGPHHADVHYTNQQGEEAVHRLQLGVHVGGIYKHDADTLRALIPSLSGVHNLAANELLNSVSKEPEDNGYDHVAPGIKQHRASGALFIHGLSQGKTVIQPGEYKSVNSSEKTLAKNAIKHAHLQSSKLRQFAVGSLKGLKINGHDIPLASMAKSMKDPYQCEKSSLKKSAVSLFETGLEDFAKGHAKKPKLGSGKRFKELEDKVGSAKLAAWIGRKKFGKKKFAKLSEHGKKK